MAPKARPALNLFFEEIGESVRCARTECGLTQCELGEKTHMHRRRILRIENGHGGQLEDLMAIAVALDHRLVVYLMPMETKNGTR